MKRASLTFLLGLALALPIWAGEIDGGGRQDPLPTPTPTPTSAATGSGSAEGAESIDYAVLVDVLLAVLAIRP